MVRTRRVGVQFLLWFAVALAIRLVHYVYVSGSPLSLYPTSDEFEHWRLATHLASGDWLGESWGVYHRPQLFAYVLAILIRVTGGSLTLIHLAMLLFDSLGVALLWLAARHALSRRAAFWGGIALVAYWPFVHFASTLYMESFGLCIQAAFLLVVVLAIRRLCSLVSSPTSLPRLPYAVAWAGILGGLVLLTRPQSALGIPFVILMLGVAAFRGYRSWKGMIAAPILFVALLGLVLLPNAVRNYVVSGQWIWYSSNGALNFYFSNNDRDISWRTVSPGMEWSVFIESPRIEEGIGNDRQERIEYWRRKSMDYVKNNPGYFLKNVYDKQLLVWNADIVHCTNNFRWMGELSPVQRALPGFGILGSLSLLGILLVCLRVFRSWRQLVWKSPVLSGGGLPQFAEGKLLAAFFLGGYAVSYLVGVGLFLAIERHRLLPLAPLFLFGGVWMAEWIVALRWKAWGIGAAAAIATLLAAVFVNLPLHDPTLETHERYWTQVNLGVACGGLATRTKDPGLFTEAYQHFLMAHEIYPTRLEPLNQLVLVSERKLDRPEVALRWHTLLLRRLTRMLPPGHDLRANELAHHVLLALRSNQLDTAVDTARDLVREIPSHAQAHHLYGAALMARGDRDEARTEFEMTLTLDPNHPEARQNILLMDRRTSESLSIEDTTTPTESLPSNGSN